MVVGSVAGWINWEKLIHWLSNKMSIFFDADSETIPGEKPLKKQKEKLWCELQKDCPEETTDRTLQHIQDLSVVTVEINILT